MTGSVKSGDLRLRIAPPPDFAALNPGYSTYDRHCETKADFTDVERADPA
jgi:hypothetical protein